MASNVSGIKREKVISGRRKLCDEELHYFFCTKYCDNHADKALEGKLSTEFEVVREGKNSL